MTEHGWRRRIAGWICPSLIAEFDRMVWLKVDIEKHQRWLGYYYPPVATVLSRIAINDVNRTRTEDGAAAMELSNADRAHWPREIGSFRQAMFDVYPVTDPAAKATIRGED